MRWWGWTGIGVLVIVAVGLFVWPGWLRGASKGTEGDKPKVETATPASAPAASGEKKKDEAVPVEPALPSSTEAAKEHCEALRAQCVEVLKDEDRCATLAADCEQMLASCPECKAEDPNMVAACLANCKKQCEDKVVKAKKGKAKAKVPTVTAGGGSPPPAPRPAPALGSKTKGSVVWWTTDLDGTIHQWK